MSVLAYVLFKVASGTEREVAQKIIEFDEVMAADIVFGEYDVIARMMTEDLDKLEDFVSKKSEAYLMCLSHQPMIIPKEYKGKNFRPKTK
jgi:DNA-binding Lrp family transcriptional regulator